MLFVYPSTSVKLLGSGLAKSHPIPEINWDWMEFHAAKLLAGSVKFYGRQGALGLH